MLRHNKRYRNALQERVSKYLGYYWRDLNSEEIKILNKKIEEGMFIEEIVVKEKELFNKGR